MSNSKRMSFIVTQFPAFDSNILDSQVYPKAKLLSELGWDCQFIGSDIAERCTEQNLEILRYRYGFKDVKLFPVYPEKPSYTSFISILKAITPKVHGNLTVWKPAWVYFRNIFEFNVFHKMVRNVGGQCLFDVRAALSNEVRHKHPGFNGRIKELIILHKERSVFRKSDHLLCVSQEMRKWIIKISGRMDAKVIPCCADDEKFYPDENVRSQLRARLGWDEKSPVIVYSGGDNYWQRPQDVVRLLVELKGFVPQLKVLILTGNVEFFSKMFAQAGFTCDDLHIRRVPHDEMAAWLNVADAGIVLRHDILLNNVASPIKIGEYLATGLAVICTKGIGDYSQALSRAHAGVVMDEVHVGATLVELLTDSKRLVMCRNNALFLSSLYSKSFERERFVELLEDAKFGLS